MRLPAFERRPGTLEALLARRWVTVGILLAFGALILLPTLIVLPPDDEGLFTEIRSTVFQAHLLFREYPFWDPWLGLGIPHPPSETLTFHPFLLLVRAAPLGVALPILYLAQMWIGLVSCWAVCRHLALRRSISALCTATYALSSVTISYLHNFWPQLMVSWTLWPLLLLLVLKLLDSEGRAARLGYSVGSGLCAGLILLNGHTGTYPYLLLGFAAFLLGDFRRLGRVWPWLCLSLLVLVLIGATKILDIGLEASRGHAERNSASYGMDFWRLFLYPINSPYYRYHDVAPDRLLAVGGPFVVLIAVGAVWYRRVSHLHAAGIRLAAAVGFFAWFVTFPVVSGNTFAREPFTIFGVLLAGLTLQALWDGFGRARPLLLAGAVLQVVVLVAGFSTYYRRDLLRAERYERGVYTPTLQTIFDNQPLYAYFGKRPDRRTTRIYMAPQAEGRLWRSLESLADHNEADTSDYEFAGWSLHDLRLVNGRFKGTDLSELQPPPEQLHSEIRAEPTLPTAADALDVLNIGYVLAFPDEQVSSSLAPLRRFTLEDSAEIQAYRNPGRWPDAVPLAPRARLIETLPARPGCTAPGLMCADFSRVRALGRPGSVAAEAWHGTTLDVRFATPSQASVLMLSQLYRPGWQAHLSNGRTVNGYRLFGGLTGFDLPAGVRSAELSYEPTARIALASLAWATIFSSLLLLAALIVRARRARRPATPIP